LHRIVEMEQWIREKLKLWNIKWGFHCICCCVNSVLTSIENSNKLWNFSNFRRYIWTYIR
jgi:hypothetical protein